MFRALETYDLSPLLRIEFISYQIKADGFMINFTALIEIIFQERFLITYFLSYFKFVHFKTNFYFKQLFFF